MKIEEEEEEDELMKISVSCFVCRRMHLKLYMFIM